MGKKKRKADDDVDITILEEFKKTSHSSQPEQDADEGKTLHEEPTSTIETFGLQSQGTG